jgi:predicted SnoaL-like aldol condensation-catalyzing enzyme
MVNTAFFIKKDGVEFKPDVIATSKLDNRLNSMLKFHAEPGVLNLQFLYSSNGVDIDFIQHTLKKIKTNKKPLMREIMVAYDPSQTDIKEAIKSRFTDQFDDDEERQKFIRRALADGQFIAIKVFIARTGRPDTERLQSEIAYVGMYAIHRAKVMEEQLWSIIGVGDLIDVTDEVMLRYQFTRQHVKANYEAPAHHKVKSTRIEQLLKA